MGGRRARQEGELEVLEPVQRVLVVTPHPDDAELGCGGTVARLAAAGKEVFYVVATTGDKGGRDTDMSAGFLRHTRREEQERAAAILGVKEVVFLEFGDGELEDCHEFRRALVYHIRRLRPDLVFTADPFRTSFYIHRDHRITGLVTMDAVFPYARDRLHYPEHLAQGLSVHNVQELYFWGSEAPDTFIDVGETVDLKARAILAHASQVQEWVEQAGGEDAFVERMRAMGRGLARLHGHPHQDVEGFRCYGIRRAWREVEES